MIKHTISAGGVVLSHCGKILVVNQRGNSWSLPKGHVDPGEDLLSAAKREIYEEAGVRQLDLLESLGSYQRPRIGKHGGEDRHELKTLHFFLFSTTQELLEPQDPENPEARWVDIDDVAGLLTHPLDKAFIERMMHIIKDRIGS